MFGQRALDAPQARKSLAHRRELRVCDAPGLVAFATLVVREELSHLVERKPQVLRVAHEAQPRERFDAVIAPFARIHPSHEATGRPVPV
ncbi:MAG: hypothetical protein M0015_04665 [Betaproteobacteria bacterium]|nr:hypothetical protein [Betaproteobacteria bacterium]